MSALLHISLEDYTRQELKNYVREYGIAVVDEEDGSYTIYHSEELKKLTSRARYVIALCRGDNKNIKYVKI